MTPDEILSKLEAGAPGTERLRRLRARVEAIQADPVHGALLAGLCELGQDGLHEFLHAVTPNPKLLDTPRGLDDLCGVVEDLRDGKVRWRVQPMTGAGGKAGWRERQLVLVPTLPGQGESGLVQVLAAVVANAGLAAEIATVREDLDRRRLAAIARRPVGGIRPGSGDASR